jgi:4-amino-4-deoxy-L-arabinose transferase-like glycosyltransferase
MYFLYRGYFEEMKANWRLYVFYVMLGFCVLLKGPVSVALAGFGVVLFALIQRNWRIFWELKPISGFIIGAITTFPWFLHEYYRTGGQSTANFFISHNIERFLGYNSPYGGGKRKPFLFYVPNLLAGAMPWTILLPGCVWKLWDAWRNFETGKELRARLLDLHKIFRPQTWFLLTWFAAVLVFFSFSAYKRPDYLMPLYPAMAILLGRLLVGIDEASLKLPKGWRCLLGFVLGLAVAFVVAVKSGLAAAVTRPCLSDKIPFVSERDAGRLGVFSL